MKKTALFFTLIISLALGTASLEAATNYWDSNGPVAGAGDTPTGTWDIDAFWSTSVAGTSATAAWTPGDTAVFSAGSDAINPFTVYINAGVQSGGLIFKYGAPTITGAGILMTNEFEFPISVTNEATIESPLSDTLATTGIRKTGPGTLILKGANFYGGAGCTNTIMEGAVIIANAVGLGSSSLTVVTNGASMQFTNGLSLGYEVELNGTGVTNSGALRGKHTSSTQYTWSGPVHLKSDASIVGGGNWTWNGNSNSDPPTHIEGTNGGRNCSLILRADSGTMNMNINGRWISLGTGTITKEGMGRVTLQTPGIASAFYFNEGEILPRYPGFGIIPPSTLATIYVAASPYTAFVATPNNSPSVANSIVLAPGANLQFDCRTNSNPPNVPLIFTCSGVISGGGGITVRGGGKAAFTAHNTYTGNTTIEGQPGPFLGAGTVTLSGNGTIANSPVIDVQSNATFEVTAVTGGYVLGASQTLKGDGTVIGNVQASGTLAPGNYVGTLTFNDGLTLGAGVKVAIDVDKSVLPANDLINVLGTLSNTGGGTVVVDTHGTTPLLAGESYQIFSQPVPDGNSMSVISARGDVIWANNLQASGSISVIKAAPTLATIAASGPASYTLSGNGAPSQAYNVYAYTNVGAPMPSWWQIGTASANGSGAISFVDTQATNSQRFYRFGW